MKKIKKLLLMFLIAIVMTGCAAIIKPIDWDDDDGYPYLDKTYRDEVIVYDDDVWPIYSFDFIQHKYKIDDYEYEYRLYVEVGNLDADEDEFDYEIYGYNKQTNSLVFVYHGSVDHLPAGYHTNRILISEAEVPLSSQDLYVEVEVEI